MDGHARSRRAETLFGAAMELEPEQRDEFLADACRDDPALRSEVLGLLAHLVAANTDELFPRLFDQAASPSLIGRQIGSYRILREIGEGGMGTVYLVEREDVGQRAALKVVRDGRLATSSQLQRFLRERRVLARLEHSGIARLFDAGVTEDRLPYLVMEYVEGVPITQYCDTERLTIDERLHLFQQVCLAVQHAHRNLVVHRDLKPSNILITQSTAGAEVKLLDFGIAKLLDGSESGEAGLTQRGVPLLTPDYASPEQVRDAPVTTASDVYSLGVILFELLCGHRPYCTRGRSPAEVERVVCNTAPERPSVMVQKRLELRDADGALAEFAPAAPSLLRRTTPDRLRRRLAGDLDTIVLEALRKDPARRYASIEPLLEDIRRHLDGRPVHARPDTPGYRMRKFVGRHRMSVAAAATFAVLLLAFASVTAVQSARIAAQADRIARERDNAQQVAAFLANLFRTLDPYAGGGQPVTIREVLDSGVARIDRDLATQPLVRAEMMDVMAQAYDGLGYHADARALIESSLYIRLRMSGEADPAIAGLLSQLAHVLVEEGDYRGAERLLRRNLITRRALYGDDHPYVARILNSLAQALRKNLHQAAEYFPQDVVATPRGSARHRPSQRRRRGRGPGPERAQHGASPPRQRRSCGRGTVLSPGARAAS